MGEFDQFVSLLSPEALAERRADNLGDLNLSNVIEVLEIVREDLVLGNTLRPAEITSAVRQNILAGNFKQQLEQLLNGMQSYGPASQNPTQDRGTFLTQANGLRDVLATHLRPILRADASQVAKTLSELESMKVALDDRLEELKKQQQAVASTSATRASSGLSEYYKQQSLSHSSAAALFIKLAIGAGVGLVIGILLAFGWFAPDVEPSNWEAFARDSMFRLLLLSIAAFALVFCVRNYRVNKHLEVLNKRRENALETFGLFQASVTSEDARNLVVGELVRAVFAHEDTGYISADSARTIIESPGGVVTALSALSRTRGADS